jgi:putative ABC transport system permease protein
MPSVPKWRRYLRFWRPDPAADVDDELRTHLELRVAELRAGGLPSAEAERRAIAEFGDVEATRRGLVEIDRRMARRRARFLWWDAARTDLRYALRGLRGSPGFSLAIVGTIAIALAATATMADVAHRLLVRAPVHVAAPDAVGRVYRTILLTSGEERTTPVFSHPFTEAVRERAHGFRAAAFADDAVAIGSGPGAAKVDVRYVSPDYFPLLGVRPALGRFLTDAEAHHRSGARVAVLGHRVWQRRFGGDTAIVGRRVEVDGTSFLVVGVAPRGFHGTGVTEVGLWLPMAARYDAPGGPFDFQVNAFWSIIVRREPGVSPAQAAVRLRQIAEESGEFAPSPDVREHRIAVAPVTAALGADMKRTPEATVVVWLTGITGVLLLIACANVAGLLLLRAARRRHEFAVRLALGVGRGRLTAQLLLESLLLAMLGGAAAAALSVTAGTWLRRALLPDVALDVWSTDARLFGVMVVAVLGTALLIGFAPALYARRSDLRSALGGAGPSNGGAAARPALQRTLLVAQTAVSLVLLVGAGLFLRSLHNLKTTDLGMDPHRVLAVSADFDRVGWRAPEVTAYFARAADRARSLPGVEAVALARNVPLEVASGGSMRMPGRDSLVAALPKRAVRNDVSAGYFQTMGTRLVQGRLLGDGDVRGSQPVTVVNESMARYFWPDVSPLGQCFFVGDAPECWTVVGVVRDARTFRVVEEQRLQYYLPLAQSGFTQHPGVLLVRTSGDAAAHVGAVQRVLQGLAPDQPFLDVRSVEDRLDPEARPWRLGAAVFTLYGAVALLLAALGLYSAVAYGVTMRTREIGVRIAIGARPGQVVQLVLRDGIVVGLAGIAMGLPIALLLGHRVAELLLRVSPRDSVVLVGACTLLVATIVLASLAPARRAARVDPTTALRTD